MKKKYKVGKPIESFEELLSQQFVFFPDKGRAKHIEIAKSQTIRTMYMWIKNGMIYKAERIDDEKTAD